MSENYLESYSDLNVHRLMLEDRPRTLAYKNAILGNKARIEGKTVLDLGCGTGILSVFCAQAGAAKVHAVESSSVAQLAAKVAHENGFDAIIEVHHCPVEELTLPTKVDVIVSEWMGFYLVHEGMLQSLIYARDKFLNENGTLFPESGDIYTAACEVPMCFNFWSDVYGVNMSCVGKIDRELKKEPIITTIDPAHILTEPQVLKSLDLNKVTVTDVSNFRGKVLEPCKRSGKYQGICLWFVVNFPSSTDGYEYFCLSTGPNEPKTHWQQTVVVFPDEIEVEEKQPIAYEISLTCRENDARKYNMGVEQLDPESEEHPTPCECHMTKCIVIRTYMEQAESMEDVLEEEEPEN